MEAGFFETIARDLSGKGQFRLILQPLAALILGVRFGIADANAGHPPFVHLMVGALLVWLPFVSTRALTNRIWRRIRTGQHPRTA